MKTYRPKTDFQFPPAMLGAWRPLSRFQREQWLIAALNRHCKWRKRRGGWNDAPAGSVFVIDGEAITDYPAFLCALGEAINGPGGYFGGMPSLSLQDCLYGAFGVTLPFTLRIENAEACRKALDDAALADWARLAHDAGEFFDEEWQQGLLDTERDGLAGKKCLFNHLLEELRFHKVTIALDGRGASVAT